MNTAEVDPRQLPLDDLRSIRAEMQHQDDVISFVRRLAQARLDLVRAEQRRREADATTSTGEAAELSGQLTTILGSQLTGGAARPPRPAEDFSDHPLAHALDALCREWGSTDLATMNAAELDEFARRLHLFEQERSHERRDLFTRIDMMSAELVRRYRDGEADVAVLLADD